MQEETKVIRRACEARVSGVWALHPADHETYAVTHVPTGLMFRRWSHLTAERVWKMLAEKLPRFAEDAAFGVPLPSVKLAPVIKLAEAEVRGLMMKGDPAEPGQ